MAHSPKRDLWSREFTVPPDDSDGMGGVKFEDYGNAAIMYFPLENKPATIGDDGHFFVRLHSWDDRRVTAARRHPLFRRLMGKRVRVTVEVLAD